jgi:Glycosyl transferases group 1
MRIFLSCQQALQKHNVPAYSFWETYFKRGIEEAGHEWLEIQAVDWAEGLAYSKTDDAHKWRDRIWPKVVEDIKRQQRNKPIDLFLSYLFPNQIEPGAIQSIQALGIPCVNFFCDNVRQFTKIPQSFYCFNLHWVPEFKALKFYQKANLRYLYSPMPVWVPPAQRTWQHPENYGISFIGSRDIQREVLLARVLDSGTPLEIRGAGWQETASSSALMPQTRWQTVVNQWDFLKQHGFQPWLRKLQAKTISQVPNEHFAPFLKPQPNAQDYVAILQQSLLTLGINRYPSFYQPFEQPDTYSRMRDIEAPMMGACYLTEWTEGIDHLYELGEEIEVYATAEEMIEKIQCLSSNPQKRQKMRYRGQQRALSEHTVEKSLNKIAKVFDLH